MDSLPADVILKFNEDTFQSVRKDYNLDKPGAINQSLDLLEEWAKKTGSFCQKDFPREYLERMLIACKGSVERSKIKLDRACTLKTLLPKFFENVNYKDFRECYSNVLMAAFLPKLTDEHYRVYSVKFLGNRFDCGLTNYYRFLVSLSEYLWVHDYSRGIIMVVDFMDSNLFELMKKLEITELRQIVTLLMDAYGIKVLGIHFVTASKTVETLVLMFKQLLNPKIFERIQIHKDLESLHKVLSKDVLPVEQGGNERSLKEIHEQWLNILSSKEHQEYFNKSKEAVINEKYRKTDKFNDEYMGIAGTFKTINVD